MKMDATDILKTIAEQVAICEKCALHFSRKKAVPGEGPTKAKIMFIGEGPGFYENEQGRPFVGPSGKFLDELLQSAGLKRSQVFIGNVVKCRPPSNRDPLPDELAACRPYLEQQIAAINPQAIVTLGRYSMAHFLPNAKISAIHGRSSWVNGRLIVPMYHPAAALHQPALRDAIVADFAGLPGILSRAFSEKNHPEDQAPAKPALPLQPTLTSPSPETPSVGGKMPAEKDEGENSEDKPVQLSLF
jgi:uracil-DNA glycosylase family 4